MRAVIGLVGFVLTATTLNGNQPLKMNVSPQQSFAPANLFVRLGIEPDAVNRAVEVVAESQDFYRSSLIALEGERGPRVVQLQFRNLPGGRYAVSGRVTDERGKEVAFARHEVDVLGDGTEP
jgi:hypothetical protein